MCGLSSIAHGLVCGGGQRWLLLGEKQSTARTLNTLRGLSNVIEVLIWPKQRQLMQSPGDDF